MRLPQLQRRKYGEYTYGKIFVTIWVARIDMDHFEAFGIGDLIGVSCIGIQDFVR